MSIRLERIGTRVKSSSVCRNDVVAVRLLLHAFVGAKMTMHACRCVPGLLVNDSTLDIPRRPTSRGRTVTAAPHPESSIFQAVICHRPERRASNRARPPVVRPGSAWRTWQAVQPVAAGSMHVVADALPDMLSRAILATSWGFDAYGTILRAIRHGNVALL